MDPDQFKKQFSGPLDEQSQRLDTTPARTVVIPPNSQNSQTNIQGEMSSIFPKYEQPKQPQSTETAQPNQQPKIPQNPRPENVIRTFQSDAAQAIERKHVSVATIALAENMKKTGAAKISSEPPKQYGKKILSVLVSLILIGSVFAGGYYTYNNTTLFKSVGGGTQIVSNTVPSIVTADTQKVIDVTNVTGASSIVSKINQTLASAQLGNGEMLEVVLSVKKTDAAGAGYTQKLTGQEILSKLEVTPPDILNRSITGQSMIGFYQDETSATPFIILTTDFFQNAYIGMIRWEKGIADDMSVLFKYPAAPAPTPVSATTTATTTDMASSSAQVATSTPTVTPSASISQFFNIKGFWSDAIIKNKDVRVFKNAAGQTLLLYSFIDKNNIIITTGENAMRNVVERIEKRTYIR